MATIFEGIPTEFEIKHQLNITPLSMLFVASLFIVWVTTGKKFL